MAGNLTIDAGSTVTLNATAMTAPLIVGGNFNFAGTLVLSNSSGGDIEVGGNWIFTVGGVFTSNKRAVYFIGNSQQTISRSAAGTLNFDYVLNQNTNGGVKLASGTSINLNAPLNGNGLALSGTGTGNTFDLNGNTATLSSTASLAVTGAQVIASSSATGYLVVASGSTTDNVNGSGTLTTNSSVTIQLYGGLNFGSGITTINGTLQIDANGYVATNAPIYGSGSLLQYYSATTPPPYYRGVEWSSSTGAGYPYNVQISNNTTLDPGGNGNTGTVLNMAGNLTVDAGSNFYMDWGTDYMTVPLNLGGNLILNGGLSESGIPGGDINIKGTWTNNGAFASQGRTVTFNGSSAQTIGGSSNTAFGYLTISNSAGVTINTAATVANTLTMSSGLITPTASLTLLSTAATSGGSTSSYVNGPLIWNLPNTVSSNDLFPVGNGGTYLPFTLNTLSGGSSPIVTVTAHNSAPSGSPDGLTLQSGTQVQPSIGRQL